MKSPNGLSGILAKDKRLDIMTTDLRKSIERLDKVIGKSTTINQQATSNLTLKKKQHTPNTVNSRVISKQTLATYGFIQ
jgi:hypothetical protein